MVLAQADLVKMKFRCVRMPYNYHLSIAIRGGNEVRWEWGRENKEFWRLYQKKNNNHQFLCTRRRSIWRTRSLSRPVVQSLMEVMATQILLKVRGAVWGHTKLGRKWMKKRIIKRGKRKNSLSAMFLIYLFSSTPRLTPLPQKWDCGWGAGKVKIKILN